MILMKRRADMSSEITIPAECVPAVLFCAASTELSVEAVVEIAVRFYLRDRRQEHNGE